MKPLLWKVILDWFDAEYGESIDPSTIRYGELLRWARTQRSRAQHAE